MVEPPGPPGLVSACKEQPTYDGDGPSVLKITETSLVYNDIAAKSWRKQLPATVYQTTYCHCPSGWTTEYTGYMMSNYPLHANKAPGSSINTNGGLPTLLKLHVPVRTTMSTI